MRLELLKVYPNLLIAYSKYGVNCSIYIMKADCGTLDAYIIKKSSSCHILNAHWAISETFWIRIEQHWAPLMLLEQQKMRQTGNQQIRFASPCVNQ